MKKKKSKKNYNIKKFIINLLKSIVIVILVMSLFLGFWGIYNKDPTLFFTLLMVGLIISTLIFSTNLKKKKLIKEQAKTILISSVIGIIGFGLISLKEIDWCNNDVACNIVVLVGIIILAISIFIFSIALSYLMFGFIQK